MKLCTGSVWDSNSWYLVVLSQNKAVPVNSWWYWNSIGLVCLYIMKKLRFVRVTPMPHSLTDRQGKIVLLKLLKSRSGALVTQFLASRPRDFLSLDSTLTNMKKEYLFWMLENPICPSAISFWLFLNSGSESGNLNRTVQNIRLPSPQLMGWVGGILVNMVMLQNW